MLASGTGKGWRADDQAVYVTPYLDTGHYYSALSGSGLANKVSEMEERGEVQPFLYEPRSKVYEIDAPLNINPQAKFAVIELEPGDGDALIVYPALQDALDAKPPMAIIRCQVA